MNFKKELNFAKNIAFDAGEFLTKYKLTFKKEIKLQDSPDTLFDEIVGAFSRDKLYQKSGFSSYSEGFDRPFERVSKNIFWWIDPIDGTRSFVKGETFYSISISLIVDRIPILGVIYQPHHESKMMYSALKKVGAFEEDLKFRKKRKINVSTRKKKFKGVIGNSTLKKLNDFYDENNITPSGPYGSFTYKACMVATGDADIYIKVSDKCNEWDSAAAFRIIEEAGGKMTFLNGQDLLYNNLHPKQKGGILITNGQAHESLVEKLNKHFGE
jgi:3'(2'), 5'-bisphosphate nucleotidase